MTRADRSRLEALDIFQDTFRLFMGDVTYCGNSFAQLSIAHPKPTDVQRQEGQFWLRMFTRAFFSLVEGVTFTLRQAALQLSREGLLNLTDPERFLLLEKRYRLDKGRPTSTDAFNSPLENVHLALTCFSRAFGVEFALDTANHGYVQFQRALKIRNGLMHPKRPDDLGLPAESMQDLAGAVKWFAGETFRMRCECLESIDPSIGAEWLRTRQP